MPDDYEQLAARLEKLEAERAIERLIHNYGHLLDFGTSEEFADQFEATATIEIQSAFANLHGKTAPVPYQTEGLALGGHLTENGIAFTGHEILRRFAASVDRTKRGLHVVGQPVIHFDNDHTARAISYMRMYAQSFEQPAQFHGFGRYLDTFARTDHGWKFRYRICEV